MTKCKLQLESTSLRMRCFHATAYLGMAVDSYYSYLNVCFVHSLQNGNDSISINNISRKDVAHIREVYRRFVLCRYYYKKYISIYINFYCCSLPNCNRLVKFLWKVIMASDVVQTPQTHPLFIPDKLSLPLVMGAVFFPAESKTNMLMAFCSLFTARPGSKRYSVT